MTKKKKKSKKKSRSPALPKRGTRAAEDFFESWGQINRFFHFVLGLVGHTDGVAEHAHNALVETERDEAKKKKMIEEWGKRITATQELKNNRQIFVEVIFVRHLENYLNYLSSLLYEIFTQRPETLRSSDKIEISSVLQHDSVESIVRDIAERKVEALSYSSFSDLTTFFKDRFNIKLVSDEELKKISDAIEIRNISVHNRCTINKRFVSRANVSIDDIGKKKYLFSNDLDELVPMLAKVVKSIDRSATSKLKLKGKIFAKKEKTRSGPDKS